MSQKLIDLIDETIEYIQREQRRCFDQYTDNVIYRGTFDEWCKQWCDEENELIENLRAEQKILFDALPENQE